MTKSAVLAAIARHRLFAVIRADSPSQAVAATRALYAGGVRLLEITVTTPEATSAIAQLVDANLPEAVIGAGSVIDAATAHAVIVAGADFVVSPATVLSVIATCNERNLTCLPGAATVSEVVRALEFGGDIVKVFPVGLLGGPKFLKAIREPLPDVPLCPTGGVDETNLRDYFAAGALAVGVGGSLVLKAALRAGDFAALTAAARKYVALVAETTDSALSASLRCNLL